MNKPRDLPPVAIDPDDIGYNTSANEDFQSVLNARLSRRHVLRGGLASAAGAFLGSVGLTACGGSSTPAPIAKDDKPAEKLLGYQAVAKSVADSVVVPVGYTATVLYALGDPLRAATPAYKNDGSDTDFENRAGDHHDGMEYFGLSASGTRDAGSTERALLAMNHEALSQHFLHVNGASANTARPAAESDKEIPAHGVSIVEIRKGGNGAFSYVVDSSFNRRITPMTAVELAGVARGNALMVTKYSTTGTGARGTINNCGTGTTPWGTLLTGEENWGGYFARAADDIAARGGVASKDNVSLDRYGIDPRRMRTPGTIADAFVSRHGWETSGAHAEDKYARWDISQTAGMPNTDYRNEANTFGYIVEIDPYDKAKAIKKRTTLGRFAHESAAFGKLVAGKPLAVYMGDDSSGEYMYKFVSRENWNAADASAADRIAIGDKYLDTGRLYVAKLNADGSGQWLELDIANPAIAGYAGYAFADQADVVVNVRLAADAVGATKMDRPEWCSVHPSTGEIYYTLTNNSRRRVNGATPPDAANPRDYSDAKGASTSNGNVNGHIIRIAETGGEGAATSFKWDVYLFGAQSDADPAKVNLSALTADQDFSAPDGLLFSPATGLLWIQTDDSAYTDVTNSMMLAAIPGQVGDGGAKTLNYTRTDNSTLAVTTHVGKAASADTLKRFLVGPKEAEITGICETPDGKALFVNIQHPGENTSKANIADPSNYTSQWPTNAGYGNGKRPRSATIVITKNDGGRIGT